MEATGKKAVWIIDPVHSIVRFESKYLLLTPVTGRFPEIEGKVIAGNQDAAPPAGGFEESRIQAVIYTNSLTTLNDTRDKHLKSADFFDTAKYPTIVFNSVNVKVTGSVIHVTGELTIKDITRSIEFDAKFIGMRHDPYGNKKAGFEIKTILNRKDYNIIWNNYFDQGGVMLSDEIDITCDVQLLKID